MQNPAGPMVIVIMVSVFLLVNYQTGPVLIQSNSINTHGNLKPFCPEFISWLSNPRTEGVEHATTTHGLGLIPAPVSMTQSVSISVPIVENPDVSVSRLTFPLNQFSSFGSGSFILV
jgi:hypothetical protein